MTEQMGNTVYFSKDPRHYILFVKSFGQSSLKKKGKKHGGHKLLMPVL